MKLLNGKEKKDGFEPFELNLMIETAEEARLMWHIFNKINLKEAIFTEGYKATHISLKRSEKCVADDVCDTNILGFIKEKLDGDL